MRGSAGLEVAGSGLLEDRVVGTYRTGPLCIGQVLVGLLGDDVDRGGSEIEVVGDPEPASMDAEPQLSLLKRALAARRVDAERARPATPTPG